MALMDKPLPEDVTDTTLAVPLEEDGDVVEENTSFSGAVAFVESQYRRSKDA